MLAVVKLEGGAGNVGFERVEVVGQRGQRVSHGTRWYAKECLPECPTAAGILTIDKERSIKI
jgi:hypothetical protein